MNNKSLIDKIFKPLKNIKNVKIKSSNSDYLVSNFKYSYQGAFRRGWMPPPQCLTDTKEELRKNSIKKIFEMI